MINLKENSIGKDGGIALAESLVASGKILEMEENGHKGFISFQRPHGVLKINLDGNDAKAFFLAEAVKRCRVYRMS